MSGALRNRPVTNRDPDRYLKSEQRHAIGGWLYVLVLVGLALFALIRIAPIP